MSLVKNKLTSQQVISFSGYCNTQAIRVAKRLIMKIGNIDFDNHPLFLAPMEDVTDIGFRMLCKRFGASMVYTEFVSAEALVRSVKSTAAKLVISDEERPVGIQLYGRDADAMVEAARILRETV